jgi:hypothetical protein
MLGAVAAVVDVDAVDAVDAVLGIGIWLVVDAELLVDS